MEYGWVELIVSGIAIVISSISLFCTIMQFKQNKRIGIANFKAEYFHKFFDKYLLDEIPLARRCISFTSDNRLSSSYTKLTGILVELTKNVAFFRFYDKKYYKQLRETISDLDEFIIKSKRNIYTYDYEKEIFSITLDEKLEKLYKVISDMCKI